MTSPYSLRFVRGSPAPLAIQAGRDTVMIEVPVLVGFSKKTDDKAFQILQKYRTMMITDKSLRGRPHWGMLQQEMNPLTLEALFPKENITKFRKAYKFFNSTHAFSNGFTSSLGLDTPLSLDDFKELVKATLALEPKDSTDTKAAQIYEDAIGHLMREIEGPTGEPIPELLEYFQEAVMEHLPKARPLLFSTL